MKPTSHVPRRLALVLLTLAVGSCKGAEPVCDPADPLCGDDPGPSVSSVEVTSEIGSVMAVGRDAQMSAAATDSEGNPVSVTFDWSSTDPSTASVSGAGLVSALAAGSTQIRASADGVTGSISLQAVDTDLDAIDALLADAFFASMVDALDAPTASTLNGHVSTCTTSIDSGNLTALNDCLADALATSGSGGNDTALLAVLSLYLEQADRILGI